MKFTAKFKVSLAIAVLSFCGVSNATVFTLNSDGEFDVSEGVDFRYSKTPKAAFSTEEALALDDLIDRALDAAPQIDETDIDNLIFQSAQAYDNLSVDLLHAVIKQESGYNPLAVSEKGAEGLMQLMPATASRYQVENSFTPSSNIRAGSAELSRLITLYGELPLALAAYNAGERAVEKYNGIPPYSETQDYVVRVLREIVRRQALLLDGSGTP